MRLECIKVFTCLRAVWSSATVVTDTRNGPPQGFDQSHETLDRSDGSRRRQTDPPQGAHETRLARPGRSTRFASRSGPQRTKRFRFGITGFVIAYRVSSDFFLAGCVAKISYSSQRLDSLSGRAWQCIDALVSLQA